MSVAKALNEIGVYATPLEVEVSGHGIGVTAKVTLKGISNQKLAEIYERLRLDTASQVRAAEDIAAGRVQFLSEIDPSTGEVRRKYSDRWRLKDIKCGDGYVIVAGVAVYPSVLLTFERESETVSAK